MPLLTSHPVLDSRTAINYYVQNDPDIGALFAYNKTENSVISKAYRIFKTPAISNALRGYCFSTYFLGEAPYNPQLKKRIPILYSDLIVQGNVKELENMIDDAWLISNGIIELLKDYPSLPLNGRATCGTHLITDIIPTEPEKINESLWYFGITLKHELYPLGVSP